MVENPADLRRIAFCAGLAAFLYQFESCLTITALPIMVLDVPGLKRTVSLIPAAYQVAALVALVPAGRLAARVGHHKTLAGALTVLLVGSAICWLSIGNLTLLLGRLVQGFGGGAMASAAYGLVAVYVPPAERRGVLGWISLGAGLGMVVGTPLGGWVAATWSWRTLFALQIPLVAVVLLVMLQKNFGQRGGPVALGFGRSFLLGLGAACGCAASTLGREMGWFSFPILSLIVLSVVILVGFVWSEQKVDQPLFPREVWQARAFWPWWSLLFLCEVALGALHFLLPFFLHEVGGLSVPAAARWMAIEVACYSLAAFNARRLQELIGTDTQAIIGVICTFLGAVLLPTGLAFAGEGAGLALSCALIGLGFGLVFPAVNAGCVARLPEAFRGLGASLLPMAINLGFMSGSIAAAEIREWRLEVTFGKSDYASAFLVVLVPLVLAAAGFLRSARARYSP